MALSDYLNWTHEDGNFRYLGGKLTPFGQGGDSVLFEFLAAVEMAFEVEMVVDRGMNGGEFLKCFYVSELRHCSFSSSERLV